MKPLSRLVFFVLAAASLGGCVSSDTPQASDQVTKDFKGGPMPPEMRKQFLESQKKSAEAAQKKAAAGGQP